MSKGSEAEDEERGGEVGLEEVLRKGLMMVAALFLIFAAWGVYSSVNRLVEIWVDYRYAPLFQLFFNIGVGVVALYGLTRLARDRF